MAESENNTITAIQKHALISARMLLHEHSGWFPKFPTAAFAYQTIDKNGPFSVSASGLLKESILKRSMKPGQECNMAIHSFIVANFV
jgi:hypothetical protein